jgi:hypothetical protein
VAISTPYAGLYASNGRVGSVYRANYEGFGWKRLWSEVLSQHILKKNHDKPVTLIKSMKQCLGDIVKTVYDK